MPPEARSKVQRRKDREPVGAHHEAQLARLIEHVREGFARYDAGAIDAFELDDVINQYKRAARELWKACVGAGAYVAHMARLLEWQAAEGDGMDWWARGEPVASSSSTCGRSGLPTQPATAGLDTGR